MIPSAALEMGKFLLENADLVKDLVEVLDSGASKESVRQAIRSVKVKISDDAFREELDDS